MSDSVIQVEGLSKRYLIRHLSDQHPRMQGYQTLRDVVTEKVRNLFSRSSKLDAQRATRNEEFWALQDIHFEVKRGERIGIIGRNGAGKSTLLKVLSRVTEPTRGRVRIRGRVASLLEVGTGFHPELTGRENIFLNGAVLGMARREIAKKFDEIVAFAEVEKFLDTPVKRYSSGMYVRLAFAVAAHLEPEILIVDEVLAVGDAQFQKKCLGKMQEVADSEGRTILFVSHNMTAIKHLCPRAILLRSGSLEFGGDADAVIARYTEDRGAPNTRRVFEDKRSRPGNELISVLECRLEFSGDTLFVSASSKIVIVFEPLLALDYLCVTLELQNSAGLLIFATGSPRIRPRGELLTVACVIPAHFLNDDFYVFQLNFVSEGKILFSLRDALAVKIEDDSTRLGWYGKWPGVIRPKLEWIIGKENFQSV